MEKKMNKALSDLVPPGRTALAVFTRNRHLLVRADGSGESGNWAIDPNRSFDMVILYSRNRSDDAGGEITIADHVETVPSPEAGRFVVRFENAISAGGTLLGWKDFACTGQNPIRYVN
jgi:hypothetical protein